MQEAELVELSRLDVVEDDDVYLYTTLHVYYTSMIKKRWLEVVKERQRKRNSSIIEVQRLRTGQVEVEESKGQEQPIIQRKRIAPMKTEIELVQLNQLKSNDGVIQKKTDNTLELLMDNYREDKSQISQLSKYLLDSDQVRVAASSDQDDEKYEPIQSSSHEPGTNSMRDSSLALREEINRMQKISLTELQAKLREALNSDKDVNENNGEMKIEQDEDKPMPAMSEE